MNKSVYDIFLDNIDNPNWNIPEFSDLNQFVDEFNDPLNDKVPNKDDFIAQKFSLNELNKVNILRNFLQQISVLFVSYHG